MRYMIGLNVPGYMPEADVQGPFRQTGALSTLRAMIRSEYEDESELASEQPMKDRHRLEAALDRDFAAARTAIDALNGDLGEGVEIAAFGRVFFALPSSEPITVEDLREEFADAIAPLRLDAPTESTDGPDGGFRASLWLGPCCVGDVSVFPDDGPIRLLYRANEKTRSDGTIRTWWMSNDFDTVEALRSELGL